MRVATLVSKYRREWVAVLKTRLHDLASKPLGDFDSLDNAAAFGYQPRNVRACTQIPSIPQPLYTDTDSRFLNLHDMLSPSHLWVTFSTAHYTRPCVSLHWAALPPCRTDAHPRPEP
jgi:hypothetical protein